MTRQNMRPTAAAAVILVWWLSWAGADTWRLGDDQQWKPVSPEGPEGFVLAVSQAKKLVNSGDVKAAREAFGQLKKDFPELTGPDFEAFIEAELLYGQAKFTRAVRRYEKLLDDYPESRFRDAALDRLFAMGTAYLGGQRKRLLLVFSVRGYAEGVKIMERVTDRVGLDSALGLRAARAVVESYEKRGLYDEAYLKWWEISLQWQRGPTGRDTLLGMARNRHASYNKPAESRRAHYDSSRLKSARSWYEKVQSLYPEDANRLGVKDEIRRIDEQIALKELAIAQYYDRTGKTTAANLYYDMVISDWPDTRAAATARAVRAGNVDAKKEQDDQVKR